MIIKKCIDSAEGKGIIQLSKFRIPEDILKKFRSGEINEEQWAKENLDKTIMPYEVKKGTNTWLNTGWDNILDCATGTNTNLWNATNSLIGVGDDATAAAAAQTDLIGANKTYKGMSSNHPTAASGQAIQFKARFLTSEANYDHAELVVKNNASGVCWNRNATGWGVKPNTEIWDYLITLSKV